jgi:hypothetical protein
MKHNGQKSTHFQHRLYMCVLIFTTLPLLPWRKSSPVPTQLLAGWNPKPVWWTSNSNKSLAPAAKRTIPFMSSV